MCVSVKYTELGLGIPVTVRCASCAAHSYGLCVTASDVRRKRRGEPSKAWSGTTRSVCAKGSPERS